MIAVNIILHGDPSTSILVGITVVGGLIFTWFVIAVFH